VSCARSSLDLAIAIFGRLFGGLPAAIDFDQPAGFVGGMALIEFVAFGLMDVRCGIEMAAQLAALRFLCFGPYSPPLGLGLTRLQEGLQAIGAGVRGVELPRITWNCGHARPANRARRYAHPRF
jgi:hypothetical protein